MALRTGKVVERLRANTLETPKFLNKGRKSMFEWERLKSWLEKNLMVGRFWWLCTGHLYMKRLMGRFGGLTRRKVGKVLENNLILILMKLAMVVYGIS